MSALIFDYFCSETRNDNKIEVTLRKDIFLPLTLSGYGKIQRNETRYVFHVD